MGRLYCIFRHSFHNVFNIIFRKDPASYGGTCQWDMLEKQGQENHKFEGSLGYNIVFYAFVINKKEF